MWPNKCGCVQMSVLKGVKLALLFALITHLSWTILLVTPIVKTKTLIQLTSFLEISYRLFNVLVVNGGTFLLQMNLQITSREEFYFTRNLKLIIFGRTNLFNFRPKFIQFKNKITRLSCWNV
jgi:hypothetical protein